MYFLADNCSYAHIARMHASLIPILVDIIKKALDQAEHCCMLAVPSRCDML